MCGDETTQQAGIIVQTKALALTFTYNTGLVCQKDSASRWCFLESQKWQGSDYIRYDPVMCFSDGDDNRTVAPECADPDFDTDIITNDMQAMTNMYNRDLVCNTQDPDGEEQNRPHNGLTWATIVLRRMLLGTVPETSTQSLASG